MFKWFKKKTQDPVIGYPVDGPNRLIHRWELDNVAYAIAFMLTQAFKNEGLGNASVMPDGEILVDTEYGAQQVSLRVFIVQYLLPERASRARKERLKRMRK